MGNICYSCFSSVQEGLSHCPYCGEELVFKPKEPIYLAPGTVLVNRYCLGKAIGAGGFGIVYKAYDMKLQTIVAVKEFFVSRLISRAVGVDEVIVSKKAEAEFEYRKRRFLAEARTMAKFGSHRSIPNVFEFFEANGTAYIVMEYLTGMGLDAYIKQQGGKIDPDFTVMIATEVAKALKSMHDKKVIHRDVAPDNVFICAEKDIRIKLMDLGAAYLPDEQEDVIDIVLKPGYSPAEQYENNQNIGPWTDIYALGATMYMMLTGIKPPEATNRRIEDNLAAPSEINPLVGENLNNSVMKALALDPHMRFRNMDEFIRAISGQKKIVPLAKERKKRKLKQVAGILVAACILGVGTMAALRSLQEKQSEEMLKPASISVWFSAEEDSKEAEAMKEIKNHFAENYPDVTVTMEAIPEKEYEDRLKKAAEKGTLPDLFESTGVGEDILKTARSLEGVISSAQFDSALFLQQYDRYYSDKKKMPLAIEVPVAYVITNGPSCIAYDSHTMKSLSDLPMAPESAYAVSDANKALIEKNFGSLTICGTEEFLNPTENTCPVMLGTTMDLNAVRELLTGYEKLCVYPEEKIYSRFIYEWSIGSSGENEQAAAERLLSWMLGNVYQNYLMVSIANDGQIPVNSICFDTKMSSQYLSPLKELSEKLVFEGEAKE